MSETCGGVPNSMKAWLYDRVRQAVAIEFDHFIAAGQLHAQNPPGEAPATLAYPSGIAGLSV